MTMLEKAVGAAYDAASGPESLGISEQLAEKIARAVLQAIQEPDSNMLAPYCSAYCGGHGGPPMPYPDERGAKRVWQSMIDAILVEEKNG